MNSSPIVVLRSVSKTYRHGRDIIEVFSDISLEIHEGEFLYLTGPSGSGKTTLLSLIAALDSPNRGQILVSGVDIAHLSLTAAARYRCEQVGIVFQSYNLLPQLTALENVLLPMIPGHRFDRGRALDLLDAVGLGNRSNHRPPELSGGEQQRVAIARALANDPALVLADEPTGNLDEESAEKVMTLLLRSCRERGKTLLLATHDRNARHHGDRILELGRGSLNETRARGVLHSKRGSRTS